MTASAAFRARYDDHSEAGRALLVEILLTSPTSRTIRIATRPIDTPDGNHWEGRISGGGSIDAITDLLSGGPDLAVCDLSVSRMPMSWQTTSSFMDAFFDYEWVGAVANVYLWCSGLPNWSDAQPVLYGARVTGYEVNESGCTIHLKQQTVWNAQFPDTQVTKKKFPGAPESALNKYVPVIIGDRRTDALPSLPYTAAYGQPKYDYERMGAGQMVSSGVLIDTGKTSGIVSVMFASHALKMLGGVNKQNGSQVFIRGGDLLSAVEAGGYTVVNDATGSRIDINLNSLRAWTGVLPIDIRRDQNTCSITPANAIDFLNPRSFAQGAVGERLQMILPSPNSLGNYGAPVYVVMAYSTKANAGSLAVYPKNPGNSVSHANVPLLGQTSGHSDVRVGVVTWPTPTAADDDDLYSPPDWNFGGVDNANWDTIDMGVSLYADTGVSGTYRVYWVGLLPYYTPNLNMLVRGREAGFYNKYTGERERKFFGIVHSRFKGSIRSVAEFTADMFCSAQGWADDGSGTYTGSASSLIAKPSDVVAFLLAYYGGISLSSIERTASTFGSLVDARAQRTLGGKLMGVARTINTETDLAECIASLAGECCSLWFVNRLTGKHSWIPWDQDAATNYARTLTRQDLMGDTFAANRTSDSRAVQAVQIDYGEDQYLGRGAHSCLVAPGNSSGGWAQDNQRDQNLTVVAGVNDKINFTTTAGELTCTLTAGDYSGRTMAQEARTRMDAATAGDIKVEYGAEVITGFNDDLPITNSGGTPFNLKLTSGSYTMASLAAHIQAILTAAGTGQTWTVTYETTRFFKIVSSASFRLKWATNVSTHCGALIGERYWTADTAAASTWTGVDECGGETFRISRGTTLTLLTNTGTNKASSAFWLLGYDDVVDYTGRYSYCAPSRRGARELQAIASRNKNGPKRPIRLDSVWLNTTEMALDLRDRTFDWLVDQPAPIRFSTLRMHDIERGMVFTVDSSLDTITPYTRAATSRSWAGRSFMVTEVRQMFGQSWHQEIAAIEVRRNVTLGASEEGSPITPPTTPTAGSVLAVWQDTRATDNKLYLQKLDSAGASALTANGIAISDIAVATTYLDKPKSVTDSSGNIYTVWQDSVKSGSVAVTGSNNGIISSTGFGDRTAAIVIGTYTYPELAVAARDAMRLASANAGDNAKWLVNWGTYIRSGYHDKLSVNVASVEYIVTLDEGDYTPATLAQHVQDKLNDAGTGLTWTVAYNGSFKFEISATATWTLNAVASTVTYDNMAWGVLGVQMGFNTTQSSGAFKYTGDSAVYQYRTTITYPGLAGTLKWTSAATTAAAILGYSTGANDTSVGFGIGDSIASQPSYDIRAQKLSSDGAVLWGDSGIGVCTTVGAQANPRFCLDGVGGIIVAWDDSRVTTKHIYAQRIDTGGSPTWTTNGVLICSAGGGQSHPEVVADGSSGAIIAWQDLRNGATADLFVQRVNSTGTVQWAANGVSMCSSTLDQSYPRGVASDSNSAIFVWQDNRAGNIDLYAQKVLASGSMAWTANGLAICTQTGAQQPQDVCSDGANGVITAWYDARSGNTLRAQRVNRSGTVQWTADGVSVMTSTQATGSDVPALCPDGSSGVVIVGSDGSNDALKAFHLNSAGVDQWGAITVRSTTPAGASHNPSVAQDGLGNYIVGWDDSRAGSGNVSIYAQKLSSAGAAQWTADGIRITNTTGTQTQVTILQTSVAATTTTTVDQSFAIASWRDTRATPNQTYVQKISGDGSMSWTANGVQAGAATANTNSGHQNSASLALADGGCIVAYTEAHSATNYYLYAQRFNSSGVAQWTAGGVLVYSADTTATDLVICTDGNGGCVIGWSDKRTGGSPLAPRIAVQRVSADGSLMWTANGVRITSAAYSAGNQYDQFPRLFRRATGGYWATWANYNGTAIHVFVQRLDDSGTVQLTANGVDVGTFSVGEFYHPAALGTDDRLVIVGPLSGGNTVIVKKISDDATIYWTSASLLVGSPSQALRRNVMVDPISGDVWVTWMQIVTGTPTQSVKIARLAAATGVSAFTVIDVQTLGNNTPDGFEPLPNIGLVSDGALGVLAGWLSGTNGGAVYAARVDVSGGILWGPTLIAAASALNDAGGVVRDNLNGAFVAYNATGDLYIQRVSSAGVLQYATGGVAIVATTGDASFPSLNTT